MRTVWFAAVFTVMFANRLLAQTDEEAAKAARAGRLQAMKERVRAVKASQLRKDVEVELEPLDEPLMRFNDSARDFHDGTLWVFGRAGRPAALMSVERYQTNWACELIALSTDRVTLVMGDGWKWSPPAPGLELKVLANSPPSAEIEAARLRQMKELVRRFTALEVLGQDRQELRLLPQPIHRYADKPAGVTDGALFVMAFGTNPEAVLSIECRGLIWYYGVSPLSAAEMSISLDGKEVWTKPFTARTKLQEPYTTIIYPDRQPAPPKPQ